MKKLKSLFTFGCLAFLVGGCTHTVVSGNRYSTDNRYLLSVTSSGAIAKAYVDKSKKKIGVSIHNAGNFKSEPLFRQDYDLTGSDIQWKSRWFSNDTVTVVFWDWGDGVSNYHNMKHLPVSNYIASLSFALDRTTGKFIETK